MSRWPARKFLVASIVFTLAVLFLSAPLWGAEPTAQNPRELKFSIFVPPSHFLLNPKTGPIIKWMEAVEQATGGRIKIKLYHSQALGKAKDHFEMARTGVADIAGVVQGYTPGYFPLTSIAQLPYCAPGKSFTVVAKALWELHKKGLLDEKYKEVKVLSLDPTDSYQLFLKNKIDTLAGFNGMKLRSSGGEWPQIIQALGATPIPLPVTDAYLGLQRGMVDGMFLNWAASPAYKLYEVVKCVMETGLSCGPLGMIMNLDTWNSLPPDIQKIIDGVNEKFIGWTVHGSPDGSVVGYELYGESVSKPLFEKNGVQVYQMSPQEAEKFRRTLIPLWDAWVKEMEGKGLPAKQVMKAYLDILKQQGAQPVYEPTW